MICMCLDGGIGRRGAKVDASLSEWINAGRKAFMWGANPYPKELQSGRRDNHYKNPFYKMIINEDIKDACLKCANLKTMYRNEEWNGEIQLTKSTYCCRETCKFKEKGTEEIEKNPNILGSWI